MSKPSTKAMPLMEAVVSKCLQGNTNHHKFANFVAVQVLLAIKAAGFDITQK